MLVKAILFKEVQPGDMVCVREGVIYEIARVDRMFGSDVPDELESIILFVADPPSGTISGSADGFIGLVHRPRPEGVGDGSYLRIIADLMDQFKALGPGSEREKVLTNLYHEIEAHKLGKPLEAAPKTTAVPDKVRSVRLDDPAGGC